MIKRFKNLSSKLKHQLILEQQAHVPDALGGFTNTWQEVATLWAEIIPISGRETFFSAQITSRVRYRIILRYRDNILPTMRLRDDATGIIYEIKSVIDVLMEKKMIEIIADADVPVMDY